MNRKFISLIICAAMLNGNLFSGALNVSWADNGLVAHSVMVGSSFEDNPLKGFVSWKNDSGSFPISMEYVDSSLRDVMKGPNSFDWSEFEKDLNEVSGRGHQVVCRFYLDSPQKETGIPQYLIDGGLQTWSVPGNVPSLSPNYNDPNLRKAIASFIKAFGDKYDGDPRIGFVFAGLIGFWGEWHTHPYDSHLSDGLPNYDAPSEVYDEVAVAYDQAFEKTKILLRNPTKSFMAQDSKFGFHDDAFLNSTLPVSMGGQAWYFAELLKQSPNTEIRWMMAPIGGEISPDVQKTVFEGDKWTGGNQKIWNDNIQATRPSWLLNAGGIRHYEKVGGVERENAIKAQKALGYDLQVETVWFSDTMKRMKPFTISVDIKNIGLAPFYYDHTQWPVVIAIRDIESGEVLDAYKTTWDLNSVPADGIARKFQYQSPNTITVETGQFLLSMKVENPLPNGNSLGFANLGQNRDGWLDLGSIDLIEPTKWDFVNPIASAPYSETSRSTELKYINGSDTLEFRVEGENMGKGHQLFIDADNDKTTGYVNNGQWAETIGAEYMLEGSLLYKYNGTGSQWNWILIEGAGAKFVSDRTGFEMKIPKKALTFTGSNLRVGYRNLDNWVPSGKLPYNDQLLTIALAQ